MIFINVSIPSSYIIRISEMDMEFIFKKTLLSLNIVLGT
jgi:hypothetical protein